MNKYEVTIKKTEVYIVEVEAESEGEAIAAAEKLVDECPECYIAIAKTVCKNYRVNHET